MAKRRSRSPARQRFAAVLAVLLATSCGVAACGGGESDPNAPLSAKERSRVDAGLVAIAGYCRQVGRYFSRSGSAPTPAATAAAEKGADEIAAVAHGKPGAEFRSGQTMRNLVGDTAEDLEASGCSRALVARLNEALARLPPDS